MIVVLGLKRTGKSSLVLLTLNSLNKNCIFIDVRKIYDVFKKFLLKSLTRNSSLGF
jgi:AAA+ ATPase superfamily predicted ATPase